MKTPRDSYGREFADQLIKQWQYRERHQSGSHIILQSIPPLSGSLSVHAHEPLRVGTFNALIRNICEQRSVTREEFFATSKRFYS